MEIDFCWKNQSDELHFLVCMFGSDDVKCLYLHPQVLSQLYFNTFIKYNMET